MMIDKDQNNEEYKLDDLDLLASDPNEMDSEVDREIEQEKKQAEVELNQTPKAPFSLSPFMKKALIIFGSVFGLVVSYQAMQSFLFEDKPSAQEMLTPVEPVSSKPQRLLPKEVQIEPESDKKMLTLQAQYEQAMASLTATTQQLSAMQSVVSELSSKLNQMNDGLSVLNQKIDMQSQMIEQMGSWVHRQSAQKTGRIRQAHRQGPVHEVSAYYLQAIIPGRAWLMSTGGATLTVQVGSALADYGTVRMIDPERGRVMTSSGRIIRFSQLDS